MLKILLFIPLIFITCHGAIAQQPPTLPKLPKPPDITPSYRANPHFYEVMTAFPDNNSYYKYKFDDVLKKSKHDLSMTIILGDHYRIGRSTEMNFKKALKEYRKASKRGNPEGDHRIAYMYADGLDLPKDPEMILNYLKKSADGGYAPAQYDYALIFLNGKFGQQRNIEVAYPYLQKASNQGHRNATELLAMLTFHTMALDAGLPTGLEAALELFRNAKDSDGEKKLLQQINTFAGLHYYLTTFPAFIKDVTVPDDLTKPEEGIKLIKQLEKAAKLVGAQNSATYRQEISEHILYHNYFAAQQNRENLIRFMIMCDDYAETLGPYHNKYIEAAARDFRLTISEITRENIGELFDEFDRYANVFGKKNHRLIADRIFVSVYLNNSKPEIKAQIKEELLGRDWILSNLSPKYKSALL